MSTMQDLLATIPQIGTIEWIGIRPERKAQLKAVETAVITEEDGLIGDHFSGKVGATRQVTLIQQEHIRAMESILGKQSIDPGLLRRNVVVSGINLLALKNQSFRIGEVILFGTGNCAPCSRMEENLGPGGYNAMCGHGGITARVETGGKISLGDSVGLVEKN